MTSSETLAAEIDLEIKKARNGFLPIRATLTSWGPGMLMNPMTDELLDELAGAKSKSASDKDIPLRDRAEKKVIRNEDGLVGIPTTYLLAALRDSGRFVKNGKKQISTAGTTTLYEFLSIKDDFLPFTNQNEPWVVDKRRGVSNNKGNSVALALIRPKFKEWEIIVNFEINTKVVSEEVARKLFEAAGRTTGMGDFRPSKKGPFGMFEVSSWKALL